MKLLVLATFFLILFAPDLGKILSAKESFTTSLHLVPVLVVGYYFYGIHFLFARLINFSKQNIYLTAVVLLAGILNILLNTYAIPIYGYEAAAYTTLISFLLMVTGSWLTTRFILKLPQPPLGTIFSLTGMLAVFIALAYGLNSFEFNWLLVMILEAVLFGLFSLLIFGDKIRSFLSD
ncbi:MAG: polysaccharide biosynthesis C-terminal domain-containing protein [Bacteroidota bacterium]